MAPEVLRRQPYGVECDVWSFGVIAYILLAGYPPFQAVDDNEKALFRIIKEGKFRFHDEYWDMISDSAKDFVASCLVVDPDQRATAHDLLQHKWMRMKAKPLEKKSLAASQRRLGVSFVATHD